MADETLHTILNEVKQAKYFTIIVDSTVDIGRIDQFSFSLRFVNEHGDIKENCLCFEELPNAIANDYFTIIKNVMEKYKLDISICRGQDYNGDNTMRGRFSGLQSKIKDITPLALYIHCCAHDLNLVLIDAMISSINGVLFLVPVEQVAVPVGGRAYLPCDTRSPGHQEPGFSMVMWFVEQKGNNNPDGGYVRPASPVTAGEPIFT
ncbi:Domain of unknown function DUF4371 [Cinara cedri]|uniref:DUF4371 domain-containing protein n=1 Tax=Cinara cedri TaxID=506608 RepID=A0A5E4N3D3_9HEMI|nr:Domain of unknown function DUF4371 [Cinara cedri]